MPVPKPLFEGADELLEHVHATQPHSYGCALNTIIVKIRTATAEELAHEIRWPTSNLLILHAAVRDEALARILTASAL